MAHEIVYRTIDIERRGYGRRYTWLPVDSLSREEFTIDCNGAYVHPAMYDIRPGDDVRWREGERLIAAQVVKVEQHGEVLHVAIEGAHPLPAEAFFP